MYHVMYVSPRVFGLIFDFLVGCFIMALGSDKCPGSDQTPRPKMRVHPNISKLREDRDYKSGQY